MPYPTCLATKSFYGFSFSLFEDLLRYVLRGFRYPTFLSLVLTFEFKGSSLSYFTTAHSGDSNLLHLNTKLSGV